MLANERALAEAVILVDRAEFLHDASVCRTGIAEGESRSNKRPDMPLSVRGSADERETAEALAGI